MNAKSTKLVTEKLRGTAAFFAIPSNEFIARNETYDVEFKLAARSNLRESRKDKRMENAIVKWVAAFLNADSDTLLIGIGNDRKVVGLTQDCALAKPPNIDGLVTGSRRTSSTD